MKIMDNPHPLNKYSDNLTRISQIIRILINELELQSLNKLTGNRISWEYFRGFARNTVLSILNLLKKEYGDLYTIWNENEEIFKFHVELKKNAFINEALTNLWSEQEYEKEFQKRMQPFIQDLSKNLILSISDRNIERLKNILASIETQTYLSYPKSKDYIYNKSVLYIKTESDTPGILDLSKAPILRPIFECFLYLYEDTGNKFFDSKNILKKYKELTGEEIDWRTLVKRKSSIMGKMINQKSVLKNRIIWEYDNNKNKYRFEILPLLDK